VVVESRGVVCLPNLVMTVVSNRPGILDLQSYEDTWKAAIDKELQQVNDYKEFRLLRHDKQLDNYQQIPYQVIFNVKFDLRQKSHSVVGGNKTEAPKENPY
jgi:flavin-binding protein dodecin